MFYIHPWEFDPAQPRLPAPPLSRVRHYTNLGRTEERFHRLMDDFAFDSIAALFPVGAGQGGS